MLELVVVRHGESIRNYASKLAHQGKFELLDKQLKEEDYEPGWELTDLGVTQAEATGKWVKETVGENPDVVIASPYLRTLQTAKNLGLKRGIDQDWRIRERRWGDYSQDPFGYSAEQYLADLAHAGEPGYKPPFPGSESIIDLVPQVQEFVTKRLRPLDGQKAVLVTHGGAMKALQIVVEGSMENPHQTSVPNCSLLHFKLQHIREDGSAEGEIEHACPWYPNGGKGEWQHFG